MVNVQELYGTLPEPDINDEMLVAQKYNDGMLELCHELTRDKTGQYCCRNQVLIVDVADEGLGRLDYSTGSTWVNGEKMMVDDNGVVRHEDGKAADAAAVEVMLAQFAGSRLLAAYDAITQHQQ